MVEGTGREHMAKLIQEMSHDDRGDRCGDSIRKSPESLLRLVDEADRGYRHAGARQEANTAGRLMTTDYAWLPPNLTASEAPIGYVCRRRTARRSTTSSSSTRGID